MTEPQVTMSGPAQLRHIAKQRGLPILSKELNQLAALWEADLSNATGLIADATLRAERAEARADELGRRLASKTMALNEAEESVDRLQATKNDLTAEIKALYAARPTLSEWAELTQARSKAETALERAANDNALLEESFVTMRAKRDDVLRELQMAQAALERARAVERQLRIASDDPRASYETSRAYERAANDLAAALAEGGRP